MRDWLTARPIAHRGLHDAASGVIENTASAFRAAIDGGYAIECDLQISADGEAMVHHDDRLGRLTDGHERLNALPATALKRLTFKDTADRMLALGELCDLVAGRATLLLELKSRFDGDERLAARTHEVLAAYTGPVAAMSFDPAPMAQLRRLMPKLLRGLTAQRRDPGHDGRGASPWRYACGLLSARPQFLAYRLQDLESPVPMLARRALGLPMLAWTVRSPQDRARAATLADQIIFEGFRP